MANASRVRIFEVGPRDGLQNESRALGLSLAQKIRFIEGLVSAGLQDLEVGAFVRPDRVPQMADSDQIFSAIRQGTVKIDSARAWCLVPNRKGLERAIQVGAHQIALFTAATDSFAKKNIGMTIDDSLKEFQEVIRDAKAQFKRKLRVRGYISTAFGCPFEGAVPAKNTLRVADQLMKLGCDEISIGDTIGVATPKQVDAVMKPALKSIGEKCVAGHFHDTRGTALANALRSIELGVRTLDSSAGGLGGCPFAPGATGNLATEDLVYMLEGMGIKTGVNLEALCRVSLELASQMNRPLASRYLQAYAASCVK